MNAIEKILRWLAEFFSAATATTVEEVKKEIEELESSGKELKTKEVLSDISDEARDVIMAEGKKLLLEHGKVLAGLTPEQQEYALNVAYLKSLESFDELSVSELMEYRKLVTKAAELGPDVAEQLDSFWTAFGEALNNVVDKVSDIGIKAGAVALKMAIPIF